MKRLALVLVVFLAALPGGALRAVEPGEQLANPALEARARAVGEELRCLVCQNETIEESSAGLAHDLRVLLRQRLAAGDTDQQAIQYIVARYGQFVLLKPPLEPATYALWFGPPAVLALGGLAIALNLRRRRGRSGEAPAPLDPAERERLAKLLAEDG
jgi:cytochrome c-type biogenesis protein CcmH